MNKIFVFMHNPRREQCAGHALADDGTLLMSEPFEDEEHMRAAFIDYPHPDVVARYKKHFPNGYKLELIYYDYLPHRKDVRDAIAASVRNGTSLMFYADNVSNWVRDEMRTMLRRLVELDATPEMMEDELTAWLGFQVDVKPIRADYEATHGTDTFDVLLGTTRITRITTHFIWFEHMRRTLIQFVGKVVPEKPEKYLRKAFAKGLQELTNDAYSLYVCRCGAGGIQFFARRTDFGFRHSPMGDGADIELLATIGPEYFQRQVIELDDVPVQHNPPRQLEYDPNVRNKRKPTAWTLIPHDE